jgi:RimJ/RimL family protein N-acetyltransferase
VHDIEYFIENSARVLDIPGTWFQLAIIEKHSNQLVGDVGIHFVASATENKQVELGYTLSKEYRSRGYATEALSAILDYLFNALKKHRVWASIDPDNTDSIQLVERLGFRKEAHSIESLFFRGQWVDDVIYAILEREWIPTNA